MTVNLKCATCKEVVEASEKDLMALGHMSDEYDMKLSDYLFMATTIIKGKQGKCTSTSGRHTWIFDEETEKKINGFITAKAEKEQQVIILETKEKRLADELIQLEENKKVVEQQIESKTTDKKTVSADAEKGKEDAAKIIEDLSEMMKMKKLDKFF